MKTTIRKNIEDLPYSLHDAVVTAVECVGDTVTMRFAEGFFEPSEGDCQRVNGYVELAGIDYYFCNAYVLNNVKNAGRFSGRKMPLKAFAEKYFSCFSQKDCELGKTPQPPFSQAKTVPLPLKGKAKDARLEIINETYGYNKSTFSGWLWVKGKSKECILELYHSGDMRYVVEE